jgi:hypothetical protein
MKSGRVDSAAEAPLVHSNFPLLLVQVYSTPSEFTIVPTAFSPHSFHYAGLEAAHKYFLSSGFLIVLTGTQILFTASL